MAESKQKVFGTVKELAAKAAFHEAEAKKHNEAARAANKELEEYLDSISFGTRVIQKSAEEKKRTKTAKKKRGKKKATKKVAKKQILAVMPRFDQALIDTTKEDILKVVGDKPKSITSIARDTNHSPALTRAAMESLVDDGLVAVVKEKPDVGPPFTGYKKAS